MSSGHAASGKAGAVTSAQELLAALSVAIFELPGGAVLNGKAIAADASIHLGVAEFDVTCARTGDSVLSTSGGPIAFDAVTSARQLEDIVMVEANAGAVSLALRSANSAVGRCVLFAIEMRRASQPGAAEFSYRDGSSSRGAADETPKPRRDANDDTGRSDFFVTPASKHAAHSSAYSHAPMSSRTNYSAAVSVLDGFLQGRPQSRDTSNASVGSVGTAASRLDYTSRSLTTGHSPDRSHHGAPGRERTHPFDAVPALNPTDGVYQPHQATAGGVDGFFDPHGTKAARAFPHMAARQLANGSGGSGGSAGGSAFVDPHLSIGQAASPMPMTPQQGGNVSSAATAAAFAKAEARRGRAIEEAMEAQRRELSALREDMAAVREMQAAKAGAGDPYHQSRVALAGLLSGSAGSDGAAKGSSASKAIDFDAILMPLVPDNAPGASPPDPTGARQRGITLGRNMALGLHSGGGGAPAAEAPSSSPTPRPSRSRRGSQVRIVPPDVQAATTRTPSTSGGGSLTAFSFPVEEASPSKPHTPAPASAVASRRASAAPPPPPAPKAADPPAPATAPPPTSAPPPPKAAPPPPKAAPPPPAAAPPPPKAAPPPPMSAPPPPPAAAPPPPPVKAPPPPAAAPPPPPVKAPPPPASAPPPPPSKPPPPPATAPPPPPGRPPPPPAKAPPPPPPKASSAGGGGGMAAELAKRMQR